MHSLARVLGKVGIGEQRCPRTLRIIRFQPIYILLRCCVVTFPAVQQEEVIVDIGHPVEVGILRKQTLELLLAEQKVVEFVLKNHAAVEQPILDDVVALGHLFFGKGNLLEIIFPLVRVVLRRVDNVAQRVGGRFGRCYGIGLSL